LAKPLARRMAPRTLPQLRLLHNRPPRRSEPNTHVLVPKPRLATTRPIPHPTRLTMTWPTTPQDKARAFLQMVKRDANYGDDWIDFSSYHHPSGITLGDAFEAALDILSEQLNEPWERPPDQ
jgi:hypothetical protein